MQFIVQKSLIFEQLNLLNNADSKTITMLLFCRFIHIYIFIFCWGGWKQEEKIGVQKKFIEETIFFFFFFRKGG